MAEIEVTDYETQEVERTVIDYETVEKKKTMYQCDDEGCFHEVKNQDDLNPVVHGWEYDEPLDTSNKQIREDIEEIEMYLRFTDPHDPVYSRTRFDALHRGKDWYDHKHSVVRAFRRLTGKIDRQKHVYYDDIDYYCDDCYERKFGKEAGEKPDWLKFREKVRNSNALFDDGKEGYAGVFIAMGLAMLIYAFLPTIIAFLVTISIAFTALIKTL